MHTGKSVQVNYWWHSEKQMSYTLRSYEIASLA